MARLKKIIAAGMMGPICIVASQVGSLLSAAYVKKINYSFNFLNFKENVQPGYRSSGSLKAADLGFWDQGCQHIKAIVGCLSSDPLLKRWWMVGGAGRWRPVAQDSCGTRRVCLLKTMGNAVKILKRSQCHAQ
jgi:hypothetical protein